MDQRGSVVGHRGSMDQRGSVVDSNGGVVDKWGGVDKWGSSVDKGSGVVDERCVRAGNSLVLHVSMVLLVFVDKVVNNLGPAVGQVDHVLALDMGTLADLSAGVHVGVSVDVHLVHVVAELVVMGDLLVNSMDEGGGVDKGSSVVNGMVSQGGSMVDGVVGHRGGVNKGRCSVVNCVVGDGGGVNKGSCVGNRDRAEGCWDLGDGGGHQDGGDQEQLHIG